jgi:hypothetical protein
MNSSKVVLYDVYYHTSISNFENELNSIVSLIMRTYVACSCRINGTILYIHDMLYIVDSQWDEKIDIQLTSPKSVYSASENRLVLI